jgi:hypothetical protein
MEERGRDTSPNHTAPLSIGGHCTKSGRRHRVAENALRGQVTAAAAVVALDL